MSMHLMLIIRLILAVRVFNGSVSTSWTGHCGVSPAPTLPPGQSHLIRLALISRPKFAKIKIIDAFECFSAYNAGIMNIMELILYPAFIFVTLSSILTACLAISECWEKYSHDGSWKYKWPKRYFGTLLRFMFYFVPVYFLARAVLGIVTEHD